VLRHGPACCCHPWNPFRAQVGGRNLNGCHNSAVLRPSLASDSKARAPWPLLRQRLDKRWRTRGVYFYDLRLWSEACLLSYCVQRSPLAAAVALHFGVLAAALGTWGCKRTRSAGLRAGGGRQDTVRGVLLGYGSWRRRPVFASRRDGAEVENGAKGRAPVERADVLLPLESACSGCFSAMTRMPVLRHQADGPKRVAWYTTGTTRFGLL
jgi:hypothetical protein